MRWALLSLPLLCACDDPTDYEDVEGEDPSELSRFSAKPAQPLTPPDCTLENTGEICILVDAQGHYITSSRIWCASNPSCANTGFLDVDGCQCGELGDIDWL